MSTTKHPKPLVIVHPSLATEQNLRVLRLAGYAVIIGEDPKMISVVETESAFSAVPIATRLALETLNEMATDHWAADRFAKFGKKMVKAVLDLHQPGER